jgi:hypothetical protein
MDKDKELRDCNRLVVLLALIIVFIIYLWVMQTI